MIRRAGREHRTRQGPDCEPHALSRRAGSHRRMGRRSCISTTARPSAGSSGAAELRITRVFSCVARGFEARPSFMLAVCCWWRSLAIDGSSGTSRGHGPVMRRPGSLLTLTVPQIPAPASGPLQISSCPGLVSARCPGEPGARHPACPGAGCGTRQPVSALVQLPRASSAAAAGSLCQEMNRRNTSLSVLDESARHRRRSCGPLERSALQLGKEQVLHVSSRATFGASALRYR